MGSWDGDMWGWSWRWRRPLFDRGLISFDNLMALVNKFHIKLGVADTWKWRVMTSGKYSTKETNFFIYNQRRTDAMEEDKLKGFKRIWKSFAPPKFAALAWRLLWDRLPTKTNLRRCGIINTNEDMNCFFYRNYEESGKHLFFECSTIHNLWMKCLDWIHTPMALHIGTFTNLLTFSNIFKSRRGKQIATSILFNSKTLSIDRFMEELKYRTWS
ncbi:hypothetical protein ACS0TY_033182 [Phlomoides rotata]